MNVKHFLIIFLLDFCSSDNVTYYKQLITKQINESISYVYHTDASVYFSSKKRINNFGTFDFIIVGAGSTGCVVANRLSETGKWNILLLEAGNYSNDITEIPNMATAVRLSDYNWGFKSVSQKDACLDMPNQKCAMYRGRGMGGSTLLNGVVYARGNRRDYDKWEQEGNPGWSFEDVFPFFKKSENFNPNDDVVIDSEFHGSGGELNVEYPVPRHPLTSVWLDANKEKGYKIVDYNGKEQIGAAVVQLNIKNGRRADAATSFIKPIKNRKNLRILTNSYVTKIIIERRKATGVEFTHNGRTYIARARKEVILSAGAIGSPQILMLSGIGPKVHLDKIGIKTIANLQVGSTLKDHPSFHGLGFTSNYTDVAKSLDEYVKEYLNGRGPLTSQHYVGGVGFYKTKWGEPNYPDLEILMVPNDPFTLNLQKLLSQAKEKGMAHLRQTGSFVTAVIGLHSKSVGTVRLKSKNPFDYPLIDINLLSDDRDIDTLYEGIKLVLNLIQSETYANINATLLKQDLPACDNEIYLSKKYWYCALRQFTVNGCHPISTCPMGPDPSKHVVDSQARVYGIRNLRVADASIFPFPFSGHPNAACVMVGEKVSDLIKRQYL